MAGKSTAADNGHGSGGDAVIVAVRVRPFNERERQRQTKLVVHMPDEQTTFISDMNGLTPRKFIFDYSYWSHDGFTADENGYYCAREGSHYADQRRVFTDIGREMLNNAWKGYNCSLFAYGQTGSGKSYSMVGFNHNKGIVPQLCEELFQRIEQLQSAGDGKEYMVTISMMEIYCEKVRDLLGARATACGGLKVRENSKTGFYVEGLSSFLVESRRDIERKILEGTQNRTIAATNLNETSSRAHTIVRLVFVQKVIDVKSSGGGTTKTSEINLVDLAGSERQKSSSRSENDRLKEGIIINKSLSALGRVIKTLHENQQVDVSHFSRATKPAPIPYRDSVLTSLLKNALGGNSKTIMLATISPSDATRDETLATLRFAERVKSVRTRAVVNESATERLLRELRDENTQLQKFMQQRADALQASSSKEELQALKRQLSENQRELTSLERNWQLRGANGEARKRVKDSLTAVKAGVNAVESRSKEKKKHKTTEPGSANNDDASERDSQLSAHEFLERRRRERPHLWNLNEDPALTDVILHFIEFGENRIGSGAGITSSRIVLKGLSILPDHALLINKDNRRITLRPLNDAEILVNGRVVHNDIELQQNDRIHFGGNHLYVFANPFRPGARTSAEISYEAAQHEIAKHSGALKHRTNDVGNRGETVPQMLSEEESALEENLLNILPDVYRANAMAKELNRNVHFEALLLPPEMRTSGILGTAEGDSNRNTTEVWVKVYDNEQDTYFLWDRGRFVNRYAGMQEIYASYADGDPNWSPPKERDPFYEPADTPTLVGTVRVFLQSLAYMVELDEQFPIVDVHGAECGQLCVSLTPSNVTGREILGEFVENPAELINQNLAFKVKVLSALGLPRRIKESYCTYSFFDCGKTRTSNATGSNPAYAHEELFTFRPITQELIDYLLHSTLNIVVSGIQKSKESLLHSTAVTRRIAAYLNEDSEAPLPPTTPAALPSQTAGAVVDSPTQHIPAQLASPTLRLKNGPSSASVPFPPEKATSTAKSIGNPRNSTSKITAAQKNAAELVKKTKSYKKSEKLSEEEVKSCRPGAKNMLPEERQVVRKKKSNASASRSRPHKTAVDSQSRSISSVSRRPVPSRK